MRRLQTIHIILLLRISLGLLFLWAGTEKLSTEFSATGYLLNATSGPFRDLYISIFSQSVVTDTLVAFGEAGIGLALLLGVVVRLASTMGILMMSLYYLSALPPQHGPISEHIIYIIVFILFIVSGAGRYYGLDKWLERQPIAQNRFGKYIFA